jgi:hypothetical protein
VLVYLQRMLSSIKSCAESSENNLLDVTTRSKIPEIIVYKNILICRCRLAAYVPVSIVSVLSFVLLFVYW